MSYEQQTPSGAVPLSQPKYGASIGEAFSRFWRKYATFSGRASRSEYWWWALIAFVVNAVLSGLSRIDGGAGQVFSVVTSLWGLAILIPGLALLWRRLHDTNRSGLWALSPIVLYAAGAVCFLIGAFSLATAAGAGSTAGAAAGGALFLVGGLLLLAGAVIVLVLTLLPSKPEGARFDR